VKAYYVPRSNPDGFSVNVRCLDPRTITGVRVRLFDDGDREKSDAAIKNLSQD
jgi:hypothetical protein